MRTYEETHPWITFHFDLNRLNHVTWMALGEAQSKCDHIAYTPLAPDIAKDLHKLYLAKGVHGTTAIEGNTLSEQEVLDKIDGKLKLPPSKGYLEKEIENIVNACNEIGNELWDGDSPELSRERLQNFNKKVLDGLEVEGGVIPGQIRDYPVIITGVNYKGAPAEDCEFLVDRLCDWLNNDFKISNEKDKVIFGILKAIIAHIYIAWIHPFGDGNGRTARLVEFQILLASGVPTPAAHLLSNYYNETRQEYYKQLRNTSQSEENITQFIQYAVNGFAESLKIQLASITRYVWSVVWENYIHDKFKDKNKPVDTRRRHLALDIFRAYGPEKKIILQEIRSISPRIAEHYAGSTQRTIERDLKILNQMELIKLEKDGSIQPNHFIILSFLPKRRIN